MNPQTDNNPYLGFVHLFQERATKISQNTARMALEAGDDKLAKIAALLPPTKVGTRLRTKESSMK